MTTSFGSESSAFWTEVVLVVSISAGHMSLPSHWLAFTLTSRAHGWSMSKTLWVTAVGGIGHVLSTLLLSLLVSIVGHMILSEAIFQIITALVLFGFGLYFLLQYAQRHQRMSSSSSGSTVEEECCGGLHPVHLDQECLIETGHVEEQERNGSRTSSPGGRLTSWKRAEWTLVMIPTLAPCVGTVPILVQALENTWSDSSNSTTGVGAVTGLVLLVLVTTVAVMTSLVAFSLAGSATINIQFLERHDKLLIGIGFIALAILAFFSRHSHSGDHMMHDMD
mmetsp:Transcript_2205/g.3803  ORF Transcript_2205/g.3803 Transcript_2205/m.3803 type:complete len:279 (+) Transcript_2205:208-1044(+)